MNGLMRLVAVSFVTLMFSNVSMAGTGDVVGFVNVTELFNASAYVKNANKTLQDNAKSMDDTLKAAQKKLQKRVSDYQSIKSASKKGDMAKTISDEQSRLTKMAQEYQQKIQTEQSKGMEEFTQLVRVSVEKVAKEKGVSHVVNSTAIIYTDTTWVDLTKDVAADMAKK